MIKGSFENFLGEFACALNSNVKIADFSVVFCFNSVVLSQRAFDDFSFPLVSANGAPPLLLAYFISAGKVRLGLREVTDVHTKQGQAKIVQMSVLFWRLQTTAYEQTSYRIVS